MPCVCCLTYVVEVLHVVITVLRVVIAAALCGQVTHFRLLFGPRLAVTLLLPLLLPVPILIQQVLLIVLLLLVANIVVGEGALGTQTLQATKRAGGEDAFSEKPA